jgi:Holliday junction DNA helicase RuvB
MNLIGNTDILSQIDIAIKSANEQNRSIPHMLFTGAAGCGKTSTARHISDVTSGSFITISRDAIKGRVDLLPIVKQFSEKGYNRYGRKVSTIQPTVMFVDEIHGLSLSGQEHLGVLMEEWYVPMMSKEMDIDAIATMERVKSPTEEDEDTEEYRCWSPEFTLIGATTNDGKLSKPFRDRFKLRFVFSPYSLEESKDIALVHAEELEAKITDEAALEIAKRGRGVPRVIVRLLERCRDLAVAHGDGTISAAVTSVAFYKLGIDETGLDGTDIKILLSLYETKDPIGLDNLAVKLNESRKVLSETVEPYLIQRGFVLRGSRGRSITNIGKRYLLDKGYIKIKRLKKYYIPKNFDRGL